MLLWLLAANEVVEKKRKKRFWAKPLKNASTVKQIRTFFLHFFIFSEYLKARSFYHLKLFSLLVKRTRRLDLSQWQLDAVKLICLSLL